MHIGRWADDFHDPAAPGAQVAQFEDPQEAAIALVVESYHLWLSYETRTDDISAIVIMLDVSDAPSSPPGQLQ